MKKSIRRFFLLGIFFILTAARYAFSEEAGYRPCKMEDLPGKRWTLVSQINAPSPEASPNHQEFAFDPNGTYQFVASPKAITEKNRESLKPVEGNYQINEANALVLDISGHSETALCSVLLVNTGDEHSDESSPRAGDMMLIYSNPPGLKKLLRSSK